MTESTIQTTVEVNDLGDIIRVLSNAPKEAPVSIVQDDETYLGNGLHKVHSYRGYYNQMAISVQNTGKPQNVADAIEELDAGVTDIYVGYKGGDFEYEYGTPVWVADYGELGNLIQEVRIQEKLVTLVTSSNSGF